MKSTLKTSFATLFATTLLAGCATGPLYYQDGKPMFVARCKSEGWGGCLEQASNACQSAGYDIREKHTGRTSSFWLGNEEVNEMVVTCKEKVQAAGSAARESQNK